MNNPENVNNNGTLNTLNVQPNNNLNQVNNINPVPQTPSNGDFVEPPSQSINQGTYSNPAPESINDLVGNNNPQPSVVPNQNAFSEEDSVMRPIDDNRFINQGTTYTETNIGDLSTNNTAANNNNNMEPPAYTRDPQVIDNIQNIGKKTVPITKELKTVIMIAGLLLVFIILIPIIVDLINKVRFR